MQTIVRTLCMILFAASAQAAEITAKVDGMVCAFCAQGVVYQLEQNENVAKVKVDLDKGIVHITTKEGKSLSETEVRKTITDAGFDTVTVETN